MGIGKSKARRYDQETDPKVTFDDVAGIDEAETDWSRSISSRPPKYKRLGGTAPTGVLLVGPPGTGKTVLAKAVVGRGGVRSAMLARETLNEQDILKVTGSRLRQRPAPGRCPVPGADGKADSASGPACDGGLP